MQAHLADHRVLEKAARAALSSAHGALVDELARIVSRLRSFLDGEQLLLTGRVTDPRAALSGTPPRKRP